MTKTCRHVLTEPTHVFIVGALSKSMSMLDETAMPRVWPIVLAVDANPMFSGRNRTSAHASTAMS
jgi:hypothetical protein